ncbi:hydroxypyruvate isomerase family protein [Acidocella aromatica]|uniref:Hydroxypyruvate isomerase n=1 Tax=Acidocella aromatica TaxID=1303579 RepID=A0A840VMJ6_9PROT|nr:TIM barrel protein [Acidocella aromatica]MBB5372690.1 hydroxypyruvate isomerase [Acidocella aromatica]
MLRFSANISTLFTALPVAERIQAAARAGFKAVEMQFPYDLPAATLREAAHKAGVEFVLINIPAGDFAGGERGIACLPGREAEFLRGVRLAGDYANTLGCPRVNCLAGNLPEGETPEQCWDVLVENLRLAADMLTVRGVQLLVEPLNRADNPRFILNGYPDADALLTAVGKDNLTLQYDTYHAHAGGEDVLEGLTKRLMRIGHIQFSDYPGRGAPGTGELNFPRLFRAIRNLPYEGWTGAEYLCPSPGPGDFAWTAAA